MTLKPASVPAPPADAVFVPPGVPICFCLILAILCARPLTSETFESVPLTHLDPAEAAAAAGPTPAGSGLVDTLLLLLGGGAWLVPLPPRRRGRVVVGAIAALAAAVVLSTWFAGDRRAAVNGGANLVASFVAGAALSRLMVVAWMPRLLLAAALASGATIGLKCILQASHEFADVREWWEKERKPELIRQGVDATSPEFINRERRIASNEAFGFSALSNHAAAFLVMTGLVAAGLGVAAGLSRRGPPAERWAAAAVFGALLAGLLAALWFTRSTGGFVSAACGALGLPLLALTARGLHGRALLCTVVGGAAYVGIILAVGLYGAARGTLPHPSLAFRWHYWSTTAGAIADGFPLGVGRENFLESYLRYKPPESPEEVSNPHNLVLTLLIELGPLGLAAAIALLGLVIHAGLRGLWTEAPRRAANAEIETRARLPLGNAALTAGAFLAIHCLLSGAPFAGSAGMLVWFMQVGAVWLLAFATLCAVLRDPRLIEPDSPWAAAGILAAVGAALVHGLVDFAMLTPGGAALFALVAAAAARPALTHTHSDAGALSAAPQPVSVRALWSVMALIALQVGFGVIPGISGENAMNAFRQRLFAPPDSFDALLAVIERGEQSARADAMSDQMPRALAEALRHTSTIAGLPATRQLELLDRARKWAGVAAERNRRSSGPAQELAQIEARAAEAYAELGRDDAERGALAASAAAWDRVVAAYPTDPRKRIAAGVARYELWRLSRTPADASAAASHLRAALAIDSRRPPEEVQRLRAAELRVVNDTLAALEAASSQPTPAASQP